MIQTYPQKQTGFALLLTLIIISVVLAIGLSLLDITLKQLILSGTARDSEVAFHAAYAGAECAQYWRLQDIADPTTSDFTSSFSLQNDCLNNTTSYSSNFDDSAPNVYYHNYEMTWGDAGNRCTEIDLYIFDATSGDVTYDIVNYGPGSETCTDGAECTTILARGYNRACADIGSLRTIQREIVVEF